MKLLVLNLIMILMWACIVKYMPLKYVYPDARYKDTYELRNKIFLIIAGIQLFVLHALKNWDMMYDLPSYKEFFENFNQTKHAGAINEQEYEAGYSVFTYAIAKISKSLTFYSCIISGVMIFLYLKTIRDYSPIVWLSVILYVCLPFLQSLFVLRQHIAVAICFASTPFILNRKIVPFLLTWGLAMSFHSSAVVFLPAYFLYKIKITKRFPIYLIATIAAGKVMCSSLVGVLLSRMDKYEHYVVMDIYGGTNWTPALIALFVVAIPTIMLKTQRFSGVLKLSYLLSCGALFLSVCGVGLPLIPRMALYYTVFYILLLPCAISRMKKGNRIIVTMAVGLVFAALYIATVSKEYYDGYCLIV